jgi:hypothetical protein
MNYLKALLMSKTIQGILAIELGALVKYLESSFPEHSALINFLATTLISGGGAHAIHGRLQAAGPIVKPPLTLPSPAEGRGVNGSGEAASFDGTGGDLPK